MLGQQKAPELRKEGSFIERLAHQFAITTNAKYIYADPVEREGVTVIPVARAAYGLGGGSEKEEDEEKSGGGGGMTLTPVGYIEIKNGETHFRPTRDPLAYIPVVAFAVPLTLLASWGIAHLFSRSRSEH